MDDPDRPDTHYVRCLKCSKILQCSRYDTNALLEHIRTDHPEIEIVENDMPCGKRKPDKSTNQPITDSDRKQMPDRGDNADYGKLTQCQTPSVGRIKNVKSQKAGDPEKRPSEECSIQSVHEKSGDTTIVYTRRYQVQSPSSSCPGPSIEQQCTCHNRKKYRTSISKWRPANGTIYCPKCGANKQPLIRTQTDRVTNSCGAACLLSCWPLCFLPFLMPSDNQEYLHCANCKNFLGLYDRDHNCIKPNREYVENTQTIQPEKVK